MTLTERQQAVLAFVQHYWADHCYAPSLRDIARHFEISLAGVQRHLAALEDKGLLTHDPGVARSIRAVDRREPPTHPLEGEKFSTKLFS